MKQGGHLGISAIRPWTEAARPCHCDFEARFEKADTTLMPAKGEPARPLGACRSRVGRCVCRQQVRSRPQEKPAEAKQGQGRCSWHTTCIRVGHKAPDPATNEANQLTVQTAKPGPRVSNTKPRQHPDSCATREPQAFYSAHITEPLKSESATWHDVVRPTCYLRNIERDHAEFNCIRNEFFRALALDPFPASTGIQARIWRSDLPVEIEAVAILYRKAGE